MPYRPGEPFMRFLIALIKQHVVNLKHPFQSFKASLVISLTFCQIPLDLISSG